MRLLWITGTDTGVGKTVVTAALAAKFRALGESVAVVKPAQTGVAPGEPGDLDEVRRLAGPVDGWEGVRLPDPLAPDVAAEVAGITLPSLGDQRDFVLAAAEANDTVLVEGSGGVAVRLGKMFNLLDLAGTVQAAGHQAQWIVVARAGLGTLNHASLTVDAIRHRGFFVGGLVIGAWPRDPGLAERHNRDDLAYYTGVPVVGVVPEGAGTLAPEEFRAQAPSWLPYVLMD
jgi:dethiobiotin synthetase